jgi:hypothetical protein
VRTERKTFGAANTTRGASPTTNAEKLIVFKNLLRDTFIR